MISFQQYEKNRLAAWDTLEGEAVELRKATIEAYSVHLLDRILRVEDTAQHRNYYCRQSDRWVDLNCSALRMPVNRERRSYSEFVEALSELEKLRATLRDPAKADDLFKGRRPGAVATASKPSRRFYSNMRTP